MSELYNARNLALASSAFGLGALLLWLKSKSANLTQDIIDICLLLKYRQHLLSLEKQDWNLPDFIEQRVREDGDKIALHYVDTNTSFTFNQMNEKANQIAHWVVNCTSLEQGDVVALFMENSIEFICTWIGLAKAGLIISLINTNLTGKGLTHCLSICKAKYFITGKNKMEHIYGSKLVICKDNPDVTANWYCYGDSSQEHEINDLVTMMKNQPKTNPDRVIRNQIKPNDGLFYIYTSGTTGLPKASIIKHLRYYTAALGFSEAYKIQKSDNIYSALPLYHSAGGVIGVGMCLYKGATLVFRKKFSATNFWKDIHDNNCTVFQYIGELCRYLLVQPPTPYDKDHNVRIGIGNGMRPEIWSKFQQRFNVPQIGEFYAATEGNANLLNTRNRTNAVGFISPLIAMLYPVKLVKFDMENEIPIRNEEGFCVECKPGEVGELIGRIDMSDPTRHFDGYTDQKSTKKKILYDVFKKGDKYFRTGDLLRSDEDGFMYFVDRIGDTFRWKGENVATSEVAEVLSDVPGIKDANVYGVEIPGHDGRAGMACIVVDEEMFSLQETYNIITENLPSYSRPLFLRINTQVMEITSTFKHRKVDYKKVGFNINKLSDKIYFKDESKKNYVLLTPPIYQSIMNQKITSKL